MLYILRNDTVKYATRNIITFYFIVNRDISAIVAKMFRNSSVSDSWQRLLRNSSVSESWQRLLRNSSVSDSWQRLLRNSSVSESWQRLLRNSPISESWQRLLRNSSVSESWQRCSEIVHFQNHGKDVQEWIYGTYVKGNFNLKKPCHGLLGFFFQFQFQNVIICNSCSHTTFSPNL